MDPDLDEDEVLRFGAGRPRVSVAARARRHPALAGLAAAAVVLTGAALLHHQLRGGPALPAVAAATVTDAKQDFGGAGTWQSSESGRPLGPPRIQVEATLVFGEVATGGAHVLGLGGPGITSSTAEPATVTPEQLRLETTFRTTLDCTRTPLPVSPDAYTVQLRTTGGGRTSTGGVPAAAVTHAWADAVDRACGSWLAATDLTVTAATASPDPTLPRVDVALTVANKGPRAAVTQLVDYATGTRTTPAGPVTIPADGTTRVTVHVDDVGCENVIDDAWASSGSTDSAGTFGLVATVGAPAAPVGTTPWANGTGAVGIPFDEGPGRTIRSTLEEVCGGLTPFAVLVSPHGAHYDAASRVLSIDLQIDGTPGKVRDVVMTTNGRPDVPVGFAPLFHRTARLVPDYTGQATATVRYRAPAGDVCRRGEIVLPGFALTARVPVHAGVRVLTFRDFSVPWQDSVIRAAVCPAASQT